MKSYLSLVPIAAKVHRKANRMSLLCIALAVLLVTAIFGMADMFLRSQLIQTRQSDGNWHVAFKNLSDEQAAIIAARPDVASSSWYDILNYQAETDYSIGGKAAAICGLDESFLTDLYPDAGIIEGRFPSDEAEAVLTQNAKKALRLQIGDTVRVQTPNGPLSLTVSGFADDTAMMLRYDAYGVFVSTAQFRAIRPAADTGEGLFYVQLSGRCNMQKAIADIQAQLSIPDADAPQNTRLLGLLGQSSDPFMLQIYLTAAALFVLVLIAGVMMIASSLNSNVAQRTQFFGMLRCVGATPKQVIRLVRAEALAWCRLAIPAGIAAGVVLIWLLCALLRGLSPYFFAGMPVFAVSLPSILAGIVVGLLTVLLAARSPAKRAARVSPLTAVSGNADTAAPVRKAAGTRRLRVDTALGVHHAGSNRKNFILMGGSFALSIILFLSFSVLIAFMNHAVTPLAPSTPDLSIVSRDQTRAVSETVLKKLSQNPAVERVYGRMFAFDLPATVGETDSTIDLISYEQHQFQWAEDALLEGSVRQAVERRDAALTVYTPTNPLRVGDVLTVESGGRTRTLEITGVLSTSPFNGAGGFGSVLCSEQTFQELIGGQGYTVIDMQLAKNAQEGDVAAIRALAGDDLMFSDRRANNAEVKGAYYAFALFVFGFLALIALITVLHIVNSVSMSVSARMKQYGAMRAIGMDARQLVRMVAAEAATYALFGITAGCIIGLPVHKLLFERLVSFRWGDVWQLPLGALGIIAAIVLFTSLLAVCGPAKRIRQMSIVDTISAL